jgi:hypothetical protein
MAARSPDLRACLPRPPPRGLRMPGHRSWALAPTQQHHKWRSSTSPLHLGPPDPLCTAVTVAAACAALRRPPAGQASFRRSPPERRFFKADHRRACSNPTGRASAPARREGGGFWRWRSGRRYGCQAIGHRALQGRWGVIADWRRMVSRQGSKVKPAGWIWRFCS